MNIRHGLFGYDITATKPERKKLADAKAVLQPLCDLQVECQSDAKAASDGLAAVLAYLNGEGDKKAETPEEAPPEKQVA